MHRTLIYPAVGQNHLTQNLLDSEVLNSSCNLSNTALKVKRRPVVWVQNGYKCISCLLSWLHADWEIAHCCHSITVACEKIKIESTVCTECISHSHYGKIKKKKTHESDCCKSGTICMGEPALQGRTLASQPTCCMTKWDLFIVSALGEMFHSNNEFSKAHLERMLCIIPQCLAITAGLC